MQRRDFYKYLALGVGAWSMGARPTNLTPPKRRLLPKHLAKGQTVGLITPGSYIGDEGLEKAVTNLESLGLTVKLGQHIRAERGFTAGTDAERLSDIHSFFADPQVDAIWCARGGYGCGRLLPQLDYRLIRKNPKVLVGYSDITALHNAIYQKTGLVTFHGPVGSSDFTDYTREQVTKVLFDAVANHSIPHAAANQENEDPVYRLRTLRSGTAQGVLLGGNLTLLASLAGTGFLPAIKNKILFLEDIGEKPYRIDRMLTTLRQAWPLEQAAGIALGIFADCEADEDDRSLSLAETLQDRLGDLGIPVVSGLSFGHISNQCTLPVGVEAELDAISGTLRLAGSGVSK